MNKFWRTSGSLMNKFWRTSGGSDDSVFGVGIYGRHHKTWWHRFLIMPIYRCGRGVYKTRRWFRCRLDKRYQHHIVRTDLEPGWHDCDQVMLHACFALLCRFVEWEQGGEAEYAKYVDDITTKPDPNAPEDLQKDISATKLSALNLYRWWKYVKPANETRKEELLTILYSKPLQKKEVNVGGETMYEYIPPQLDENEKVLHKEFWDLEKKMDDDEQEMLHRLIDIRRTLWT